MTHSCPASAVLVTLSGRRGVESSERLGRYRWVVERTLAWIDQYRRLTVRYERLAEMHRAFLTVACALICWKRLCRGS